MLLVIDVGNSEICFGTFDLNNHFQDTSIVERGRFSTTEFRDNINRDEILKASLTNQIVHWEKITNILISCVAPSVLSHLKIFCYKFLKCSPLVLGEDMSFPTQALIDNPLEAGADLRVNSFAAHIFYQGPLMLLGFGTATTFSLVNDQGDFCGTAIAPGIGVMSQALPRVATHLPQIDFKKPASPLGLNTVDAMESGLFWGYISLIKGLIEQLQPYNHKCVLKGSDLIKPLKVIATGGYAAYVAPHCADIEIIDSDLTLKGLALIFKTKLKGK